MKTKLDKEEKDILKSYDNDEWIPAKKIKSEKKKFQEYAKATIRKDNRINIRITTRDLQEIQKKAIEDGLPYQTLISSILHKYINGRFKEEKIVRK